MATIKNPKYEHWRSTHYGVSGLLGTYNNCARRTKSQTNRASTNQQTYRNRFHLVNDEWHSLTLAQQDSWNLFGSTYQQVDKYGDPIYLSGYNWFMRLNTRLITAGEPTISNPPPDATPSYSPTINLWQGGSCGEINLDPIPQPGANQTFIVCKWDNHPISVSKWNRDTIIWITSKSVVIYPIIVAVPGEITFNTTKTSVYCWGIDSYGRIGDYRFSQIVPVC